MTVNRLVLSGTISKLLSRKVSLSGIPHYQFMLSHHSQQIEAGLSRQAWCKMSIIASGQQLEQVTRSIAVGTNLIVHGFISTHQGRNGLDKLVLHAEQIELIDTGD